jgi:hypothetical protein
MHYVTDVNSDPHLDASISRYVVVTFGECALDFDGALGRFEGTVEFDQKCVADSFDFSAVKAREQRAEDLPVLL